MSATLVYRRIVTERGRGPRFRGLAAGGSPTSIVAENPVCGDTLTLALELTGPTVRLRYDGHACFVCIASTDVLAETVEGVSVAEALRRSRGFLDALASGDATGLSPPLATLLEVRSLPVRLACARLAWDAVERALVSAEPAR